MSMLTVLCATIAIFALGLLALSIGLLFGRRGLRAGCCGSRETATRAHDDSETASCGTCTCSPPKPRP